MKWFNQKKVVLSSRAVIKPKVGSERILIIIGINYIGTQYELTGCYNDALKIGTLLTQKMAFKASNVYRLSDANQSWTYPSAKNIINTLKAVVNKVKNNPTTNYTIYFHYSGHGSNVLDSSSDETDKQDEMLVSADLYGILDDTLYQVFVKELPVNALLIATFDSCFSGTVLDLPFVYSPGVGSWKENNNPVTSRVIEVSSSRDSQVSYESNGSGFMTSALVTVLKNNSKVTVKSLCELANNQLMLKVQDQNSTLSLSRQDLSEVLYFN